MIFDVPRINESDKNNFSFKNSTVIFNLTKNTYQYFDGKNWVSFSDGDDTFSPKGFPINGLTGETNREDSVITFTESDRKFSISPKNESYTFFIKGKIYKKTTSSTQTIDDTEGFWYFYFDENGDLQKTNTYSNDLILKYCYVAYLYWDATNKKNIHMGDERHGVGISPSMHLYSHALYSSTYISGLKLLNFNTTGSGTNNNECQFQIESGFIRDEDIPHFVPETNVTDLQILYRENNNWRKKIQQNYFILRNNSNKIVYNSFINNSWQLTEVSNNKYICLHIIATNDINNKIFAILGQKEYAKVSEARANINNEINNLSNLPFHEFKIIGTVIYLINNDYTNELKAKIVKNDLDMEYVDSRFINLQTQNALIYNHNNLNQIDSAPYYHSNQPIKTSDDVIFNSIKANKFNINDFDIIKNSNSLSVGENLDLGDINNFNYILSSNSTEKNIFLTLNKKNSFASIGLKSSLTKDEFLLIGKNATDFVFVKNAASPISYSSDNVIAKITTDGELIIKSITINNSFKIDSMGIANFSALQITNDLTVNGNLIINGELETLNISNLTIEDPIIKINKNVTNTYISSDIGLEFNYYDTNPKIGFFGMELESNGSVKHYKLLKNAVNTSQKYSGDFADLKLNNISANDATLNNLTVNSRKMRVGVSNLLTNGNIDLSSNSFFIFKIDQTVSPVSSINLSNGIEGEVFYLKIKSNGSVYSWANNIKWPNNQIISPSASGKVDVYQVICFLNNVYHISNILNFLE